MKLIKDHADHHGGTRPLSSLTAIVLHETVGKNDGDYSTLKHGGPHDVSVHYWVPDYDDPGAARWAGKVYEFLAPTITGNAVGMARTPYGNSRTISIEMGHYGAEKYGEAQLVALDELIAHIDKVVGRKLPLKTHAEIALPPGRKSDPGRMFPMAAYRKYRAHIAPAPKPQPPHTDVDVRHVVPAALNLRAGAGTRYKVIHVLKHGEAVQVMRSVHGWLYVKAGELVGYVAAAYVK